MKLLFDQNISHVLADRIQDLFPGSIHVREIGLQSAGDEQIWNYAKENNYAIVSKDSDFHQRSFLYGTPPKAVCIRRGNCTTEDIVKIVRDRCRDILGFNEDAKAAFLILD